MLDLGEATLGEVTPWSRMTVSDEFLEDLRTISYHRGHSVQCLVTDAYGPPADA